ncbi:MAG: TolC family protein, partial [Deltaproteobacteria bacterium]|nr:TolC family protein [Kofleriaceae bacterium]
MIRFRTITAALVVAFTTLTTAAGTARADEVRISLADAIDRALGHHPDLAVAGFAPRRAAAEVERQRGAFDPTLSLSIGFDRDRLPGAPVLGSYRDTATAEARLAGRTRWGTEYALSYGTARLETDAATAASNPTSSAFVELHVRQPLLRGFGRDVNLAGITVAQGQERIAAAQLVRATDAAVIETVNAYWRLVRAHRSLAVANESLELARRLVTETQVRVDAGALPPIELTQARASVAAREEAVIVGEAEVGKAGDALARIVQIDPSAVFDVTLVPTDDPAGQLPARSLAELLAIAHRERAELVAAREVVKTSGVVLASARDRRRPELSVVGSAGVGGLDGSWLSSQGELGTEPDQHRFTAGLVFSMPLGNRSADASTTPDVCTTSRAATSSARSRWAIASS